MQLTIKGKLHTQYIKSLIISKKRLDGQRVDGHHLILVRKQSRKLRKVRHRKLVKINYLIGEWIHLDPSSFGVENDYAKVKTLARYVEKLGIECYASRHYDNCFLAVRKGNEIEVYKRFNCRKNKRKYYLWYEQNIRSSREKNA